MYIFFRGTQINCTFFLYCTSHVFFTVSLHVHFGSIKLSPVVESYIRRSLLGCVNSTINNNFFSSFLTKFVVFTNLCYFFNFISTIWFFFFFLTFPIIIIHHCPLNNYFMAYLSSPIHHYFKSDHPYFILF